MRLEPVVAGQFYPRKREELEAFFKEFDSLKVPGLGADPVAFLLPHAGYPYSGSVAALGYRSLSRPPRTVVVAGPSHYLSFKGVSIFPGESVGTPLGDLAVDQEACELLIGKHPRMAEIPEAFAREHSVEVHFPLIHRYLPGAKVVPLVLGQGWEQTVRPLVKALLALWEKGPFLFVASSDLSHYPAYDIAKKADKEFLDALLTGDERKLETVDGNIMGRRYKEYHCTHCGKEPVAALLGFARGVGASGTKLLEYRNSGDVTGDLTRVVGYAAVAFCKE